jgi:MFS family permease
MSEAGRAAPQGVPAAVKGLSLVSLFNDFASEMVYPLLPAFVTGTLGGGAAILGALDGAADLTQSLMKWVSGRLADRPGWRGPLILGGYLTAVLVRPLIAVSGTAAQVVGFRVIDRVGKGIRTPPRDALISEVTPPAERGRAFGFHRGADHFGAVVGSLTAWYLLQRAVDVRHVIEWSAVPGIAAFLILAFVLRGTGAGRARATAAPGIAKGPERRDATRRVFWGAVLSLAALVLFRMPEALLLLRLQDLGVAVPTIPLVWAGLHVVRSASSYPGGWLSDRVSPGRAVATGGALFALVVFLLGLHLSSAQAIAVFLLLGLVAGLMEPAERVVVSRLAPVRTGRGFGVYHSVTGVAVLPASLAFGALYQEFGAGLAFRASAVTMLIAVGIWLTVTRGGRTVSESV